MSSNVGNVQVKLNLDSAAYEQGIKAAVGSMNMLGTTLGALGIGFGAVQIKDFISDVSKVSVEMDGLTNKFDAAAGGAAYGANSMQFVRDEAQKLGLAFKSSADSFSGFEAAALRSGLSLNQTKETFDDVASAATALHLSGDRTELVFMALEQMASKGVVSMEELRRQLGDQLPGAFEIAAKSMGVSTYQFNKMVSSGQVMSADFLPKFAKAIKEELGGSAEQASKQANASFNRFGNAVFDVSDTIGDGLNPALAGLATHSAAALGEVNNDIKSFEEWTAVNNETINSVTNTGLALATIATVFTGLVAVVEKVSKMYTSATAAIEALETATLASEAATQAAADAELALYVARLKGDEAMITECVALSTSTAAKSAEAAATVASTRVTVAQYLATGNLTEAFALAATSVKAFTVALLANPWTWVALGIGAVTAAVFAYKNSVESTRKAIEDLNAAQDQQVNKTTDAINTIKELQGAKNLDYNQTKRLDEALSYLTAKYPNYIGRLRQELSLKGQISQATAEQIANEMTLAKVKGLQQARVALNKDMMRDQSLFFWRQGPGRTGITKANQKRDDDLIAEQKKLASEHKGIINDLISTNKPSRISGFNNTVMPKKAKKKKGAKGEDAYEKAKDGYESYLSNEEIKGVELTNAQKLVAYKSYLGNVKKTSKEETDYKKGQAQLIKAADKDSLDLKLANLDVEKYATQKTDDEIYAIELKKINLKLSKERQGTVEYAQILSEKEQLELDHEQKIKNLKSQQVVDNLEYSKQEIDGQDATLELQYEANQISKIKMLELEISNVNQKKGLEKQALQEQLQLIKGNVAEEVKLKRASNREQEELDRELLRKSIELQNEKKIAFKTFTSDVSTGWGNTVSSLIKGDVEVSNVFTSITDTLIDSFANACGVMVETWFKNHLTMETITKLFGITKISTDQAVMASNGLVTASNEAVAVSSAQAATTTATSGGVMAGAMSGFATAIGPAITAIGALAASMAALALSSSIVAITMPIIAVSTAVVALSSALAALGLGAMNAVMMLTAPISLAFAPVSALLAGEFIVIAAAAKIAAIATGQLAIALAAASAASIPLVGWTLAPAAASLTGAAIAAADTMVEFREKGGPVKAGQPYVVGEKRPEIFIPDRSGTILPNTNALGGGGSTYHVSVVMPISATDAKSFESRVDGITARIHSNLSKAIKGRKLSPLGT